MNFYIIVISWSYISEGRHNVYIIYTYSGQLDILIETHTYDYYVTTLRNTG